MISGGQGARRSPLDGRRGRACVGILTILDEELDEVRAAVGASYNIPHTPYYVRAHDRLEVVVRRAPDRSNVPAVRPIDRMLEDFRPEVVLVVGIAGGVEGRGVELGDVIVPDYLHYGDFRKLSGRGDHRRYYAYDQPTVSIRESHVDPARADGAWCNRIREQPPRPTTPQVRIGTLVAGEKVLGDPTHVEQRRVLREFPEALAIDMESVGAARAVHEGRRSVSYNPRFAVVRGVSDLVRGASASTGARQRFSLTPGGLLREVRWAGSAAAAALAAAGPGSGDQRSTILENSDERDLWRHYAASTAAAFASDLVDRFVASTSRGAEGGG